MPMLGKFVMISGDNYYHTGRIIEEISSEIFMVEFVGGEGLPTYRHIFHVNSMLATIDEDGSVATNWTLFDSQEELETWLEQLTELAKQDELLDMEQHIPLKRTLQ